VRLTYGIDKHTIKCNVRKPSAVWKLIENIGFIKPRPISRRATNDGRRLQAFDQFVTTFKMLTVHYLY